ncbi:hypothetical protein GCM10017783_24370 [Deinococcus piscis]|uniref:FAD-binding PCMH-type domain-containing protein n=1 Tax=Deinococcus piscis TaxID=394230 RepID=A0ABQ3KDG4_9DEIO|nr:FAD-binding protein [Deinococcus piscis]GHG11101.1 hypothetical protein GCM10017783_24370 [Deinococcus piscis]
MPVLELNADDQTVTVSAGCSCAELYAALPPGLLPPVPPLELPGGVGGLVTRGGFGQTFFFPADVLGLTFAAPSGNRIQAGGRTVKNVQGYDLTRLFVGSFGVLGELEQVTLRLRPGRWLGWAGPGSLPDLKRLPPQARFAWLDGAAPPERQLRVLFSSPPPAPFIAEPVEHLEDWTARFPAGLGVAAGPDAVQVQDARFGWTDGAGRPTVPPLFQRLADAL